MKADINLIYQALSSARAALNDEMVIQKIDLAFHQLVRVDENVRSLQKRVADAPAISFPM